MDTFKTSTTTSPSEFLTTVSTRQTFFSVDPSLLSTNPEPLSPLLPSNLDPSPLPSQPVRDNSFRQYATKLGYPDNLIARVLNDLGEDAEKQDLLSHLINLQDMLCPKDSTIRRRRDATDLPPYMLAQDCFYKGKERMPFWVWVKRETIGVNVTENPPHKRTGTRSRSNSAAGTRSRSSSSSATTSTFSFNPTS